MKTKRVAIIGGGIAGLTAAWHLASLREEFVLFEAGGHLGGVITSERTPEGFLVEGGPDSFLTAKPAAIELARALGLSDQLLASNDHQRKTYILLRNRLLPIPDGMQMMVPTRSWPVIASPLFSFATKLRMVREYLAPPEPLGADQDESVASFVTRHFGREMVERLADPLLAGVYGGDSSRLSARAVLPMMVASEAKHRSLVRGALKARAPQGQAKPLFTTFRNGMRTLTERLADELPDKGIRVNTRVNSIARSADGWQVNGEAFTHVILALPAPAAASLLWPHDPALSALLGKVAYTSCITVALGYDALSLPPGFGFLVPASEGRRMIACTFVHRKFDQRAPEGKALLRIFITSGLDDSDDAILATVRDELRAILGITAAPTVSRISRWRQAMAQYDVGHLDRIAQIEQRVALLPGLRLIGNAYRGIGVPDCIRGAKGAVEQLLAPR
jgi:oxygen-dependent protoporphyrinogen oxidase